MRSKGADSGDTLEGDPPEDECGVSSSVPHAGGVSNKWYSLPHSSTMRQHTFTNHTDMLYVNLEESCPSSPTYLERDPNMSCTARYSPAAYTSTTPVSGVSSQPPSLNTTPPSNSVEVSQGNILTPHYQRQEDGVESQQNFLQYHSLNTDRLAPLLQVLEGVTTSPSSSYFPSTVTDTFGVSSSNSNDVSSGPGTSGSNIVSTTVCEQPPQVHPSLFMPITQQPLPTSTQSSIEHTQTQLMDTSDLQFILTSDCEYHMMEGGKADQVELFIARDPSGTSYSLTTENGFLIARPTLTTCSSIKPESMVSEVNSIPVDVSILDSLDEATQFDEEHHNIVMEAETLSSPNLHFNQSDELVLQTSSSGDMTPSPLEEVECGQMVDLEEIAEYLGSQPSTPTHEEILSSDPPLEKPRGNRRRQQQFDNSIMCIPDKTVPCRARASLPATHLSLGAGSGSSVKGVFARRRIPIRARFGPLEGSKKKLPKTFSVPNLQFPTMQVKFLVRTSAGDFVFDVSDERTSNWMRYVRFEPGPLQNVCLHQADDELFFITCRPIAPRQELILGYGTDYAKLWGLPAPPLFASESDETALGWPCYECSLGFPSSSELQAHLNTHDEEDKSPLSRKPKKKPIRNTSNVLHICSHCNKSFSSIFSLKRHVQTHEQNTTFSKSIDNQQRFVMDQQIPMSSNIERMDFESTECTIKRESNFESKERHSMDLDDFSHVRTMQKHAPSVQQHVFKREPHYHGEQEQLVPDSQMDNDSLDSNCTDLNVEDSYQGIHKDMSSLDANVEIFLCNVCNKVMDNALQLELHSKDHETGQLKPVSCPSCPTESLNSINQKEESIQCNTVTDDVITKPAINTKDIDDSAVTTESKTSNTKTSKSATGGTKVMYIHCPVCPRTFKNGPQLKDHVQNQHMRPDGKYDCPLCSMIMSDYKSIKKHIRVYHAVRRISCLECGNNFATNDKLRLHMLKHSDRRDFVCGECGKQFKRRDKLKDHTKKQHSRDAKPLKVKESSNSASPVDPTAYLSFTFKCHPCKRGFKRRGMLVNHLAKRHPDVVRTSVPELQLPILRVARNYYCQHCDKVYKSSSKRKAHIIKNHPGESIPPSSRGRGLGNSQQEGKEGFSKCVGAVPSAPHTCPHQPCHKQYASKAKLLQHIRLKHSNQVIESKENNVNKAENNVNVNPPISKSDVSSSTTSINHHTDRHHTSDFSDAKVMKANKVSYQQYDSVSEKMVSTNVANKSKIDETVSPIIISNSTKWENNKIHGNLLSSEHSSQTMDGKFSILEPSPNKPLTEIKLGGYLTGSSSKQSSIPPKNIWRSNADLPALISSTRNTNTRYRIIQLSDGTQIIEESDLHQIDLSKKIYGKLVGDPMPRSNNTSGQLVVESNKLPPVSVLAGNTNKGRYTDR